MEIDTNKIKNFIEKLDSKKPDFEISEKSASWGGRKIIVESEGKKESLSVNQIIKALQDLPKKDMSVTKKREFNDLVGKLRTVNEEASKKFKGALSKNALKRFFQKRIHNIRQFLGKTQIWSQNKALGKLKFDKSELTILDQVTEEELEEKAKKSDTKKTTHGKKKGKIKDDKKKIKSQKTPKLKFEDLDKKEPSLKEKPEKTKILKNKSIEKPELKNPIFALPKEERPTFKKLFNLSSDNQFILKNSETTAEGKKIVFEIKPERMGNFQVTANVDLKGKTTYEVGFFGKDKTIMKDCRDFIEVLGKSFENLFQDVSFKEGEQKAVQFTLDPEQIKENSEMLKLVNQQMKIVNVVSYGKGSPGPHLDMIHDAVTKLFKKTKPEKMAHSILNRLHEALKNNENSKLSNQNDTRYLFHHDTVGSDFFREILMQYFDSEDGKNFLDNEEKKYLAQGEEGKNDFLLKYKYVIPNLRNAENNFCIFQINILQHWIEKDLLKKNSDINFIFREWLPESASDDLVKHSDTWKNAETLSHFMGGFYVGIKIFPKEQREAFLSALIENSKNQGYDTFDFLVDLYSEIFVDKDNFTQTLVQSLVEEALASPEKEKNFKGLNLLPKIKDKEVQKQLATQYLDLIKKLPEEEYKKLYIEYITPFSIIEKLENQ